MALKRALDVFLATASGAILALVAGAVIWQVVTRYILGIPSTSTSEIARLLFMWLALLSGAYAFGQKRHLAIDFLPQTLTGRSRTAAEATILAIVAIFAGLVMVRGGSDLVLRTLMSGQITPTLGLPMGWIYAAIPVAGGAILFYCLWFARGLARGEDDGILPSSDSNTTG
ncbi:TRAP transporter small permease [Oricola cellulosilytica]|uniref:TRAP transporter small permease protein n=1 Tax=Oricola cellulosilytica TaxID=1429082 RepID=A0A4R0PAW1_9HYPH|nr:TRAP transporter small permease [Oricola cellulosilytica]TCD13360.1 TRAP transporter small permease [Oricola cellulosilytica]